jgi:hypothetical protein
LRTLRSGTKVLVPVLLELRDPQAASLLPHLAAAEFSNTLPGAFVALLIFLAGVGMVLIGVMQVIRENSLLHRDVVFEALRSLEFGR